MPSSSMHTTHRGTGDSPGGLLQYLGFYFSLTSTSFTQIRHLNSLKKTIYGRRLVIFWLVTIFTHVLICEVRNVWPLIYVT